MVTIIDYGMGNLGSVYNMFKYIKVPSQIVSDVISIEKATKILLPGVGSFGAAMEKINASGLKDILNHKALVEKVPVLGICLGMQLLTSHSEEGDVEGLNWIDATTKQFRFPDNTLKVPHMGWNKVTKSNESPLTAGVDDEYKFYFVHSYFVKCADRRHSILETTYGDVFDSGIQKDNIYGVQFHPEKSHKYGMKLFANFAAI
jgi:imidazole glycerol-phosphate synthase subunit HisH